MKRFLIISSTFFLFACTPNTESLKIEKTIYTENFAGLTQIGSNYRESKFDYDLDAKNGNLIHFKTCADVENAREDTIREDQFPLFTMLKLNCEALKQYFAAKNSARTYLPESITGKFIQNLPADATPYLGGDKTNLQGKVISQIYPRLTGKNISPTVIQVSLDDLEINYTVLVRGDFDGDTKEDMLLRLDWINSSAFGNGYDLIFVGADENGATQLPTTSR